MPALWMYFIVLMVGMSGTPRTSFTIVRTPGALDTLVTTLAWANTTDGKGPLDSITAKVVDINSNNITSDGWIVQKFVSPFPTTAILRQPLSIADATYNIVAEICAFRAEKAGCSSATVPFVYVGPVTPAPTGVTVGNARVGG